MLIAKPNLADQNSDSSLCTDDASVISEVDNDTRRRLPDTNSIPEFFELLQKAREGDDESTCVLLERYRNYLLVIANDDTDSWLKEKVGPSDIVQATLISGFENLSQFRGESEGELIAWLKAILKNGVRRRQRRYVSSKRNVNRETKLETMAAHDRQVVDQRLTPQSEALANEKRQSLEQGLSRLTAEQRQVVELRNFEQLSFSEIGQRIGRTSDAARKFWARSIEALKTQVKSDDPELMDDSCNPANDDD